jgi:hypothetical protein
MPVGAITATGPFDRRNVAVARQGHAPVKRSSEVDAYVGQGDLPARGAGPDDVAAADDRPMGQGFPQPGGRGQATLGMPGRQPPQRNGHGAAEQEGDEAARYRESGGAGQRASGGRRPGEPRVRPVVRQGERGGECLGGRDWRPGLPE